MTVYLTIPLDQETAASLRRLAATSLGITPEALGAEAIERFVSDRQEARRRVAESAFLLAGRRQRAGG